MRESFAWGGLFLLAAALSGCRGGPDSAGEMSVAVEERTITPRKRFLARFEPGETVPVHSHVDGRVLRVLVEEGQRIEEGQIVVELDKRQVDRALKEVDSEEVRNGLKWLRKECDIRSPVSGKALSIHVKPGQDVGGMWGALPTTKVLTLMPEGAGLVLKARLSQEDAESVQQGGELSLDARGSMESAKGVVLNVVPERYHVTVELGWEGDLPWRPEVDQLVKVDLVLPAAEPGPAVPLEALERREGNWFVRLSRDGAAVERSVVLGPDDDRWVRILEGVSRGDTVLVRSQ